MADVTIDHLAGAFRSPRLVYRAFENDEADRHFLHTALENDPVTAALSSPGVLRPKTRKQTEAVAEQLAAQATLAIMVCLPSPPPPPPLNPSNNPATTPGTPIGYVVLGWGHGGGGQHFQTNQHRCATLGIALAPAHQGAGYGGEALAWALDWAFRHGGYHRAELSVVARNERALRCYRRLGFREEGRRVQAHWLDGRWWDVVEFGMLGGEWEGLRGRGVGT